MSSFGQRLSYGESSNWNFFRFTVTRVSYPMFHLTCVAGYLAVSARRLMSVAVKPTVIFVLGGPGAGKGTQCEKIVNVSKSVRFRSRYLNHILT